MKLQFSLRTMLWLALVAAVAFGWWRDHTRLQGIIRQKNEESLSLLAELLKVTVEPNNSWSERGASADSP